MRSPLPWNTNTIHGTLYVESRTGSIVAEISHTPTKADRADADFIVEACNNYERVKAALEKIANRECDGESKSWRAEAIEIQDEARAALAKEVSP